MDDSTPSPRHRVLGAGMIIAPLLLLASTVASVAGDGLGRDQAGGVLQMYAAAAFVLAVIGLTQLVDDAYPRASAVLTVIGALGCCGAAGYAINSIYVAIGTIDLNENVDGAAAAGQWALRSPGILFPLAFIGLGIALLKAGVEPRWSGAALILGGILFPVTRIGSIDALAPLPDVLLFVGLAPLGVTFLRGRAATRRDVRQAQPAY